MVHLDVWKILMIYAEQIQRVGKIIVNLAVDEGLARAMFHGKVYGRTDRKCTLERLYIEAEMDGTYH